MGGFLGGLKDSVVDAAKGLFGAAKDAASGVLNVVEKGASLAVDRAPWSLPVTWPRRARRTSERRECATRTA